MRDEESGGAGNGFAASFEPEPVDDPAEEARIRHWQDSPFAVGKFDPTWRDGMRSCCTINHKSRSPKSTPIWSAWICGMIGAHRVGNMAVLWKHDVAMQLANGDTAILPRIDVVVGPYWFVAVLVTYPAIIGLSLLTAFKVIKHQNPAVMAVWSLITMCLILSLSCVSCRDPGILIRHKDPPNVEEGWLWNDQALTFRPRKAKYDKECGVVIDELDHVCPWTGTAIGKNNMPAFKCFVPLVIVCLTVDIILLVAPI